MTFLPWQLYSLVVMFGICIGVYLLPSDGGAYGRTRPRVLFGMNLSVCGITLMALPTTDCSGGCRGFVIFRIPGYVETPPIRWFDRNAHGGMGIMIDDIVAGVISAGILYFIGHHFGRSVLFV
ncbi:phosphatidylglycerophosphatase A [Salmonella enterica subsp. enterica]|nr:phosphatidylglycerophosphatase A [Salmonella enterica subsp. enterica]